MPSVRRFDTGATRDTDDGKLDYEGFFSPLVLECVAEYMHKHRFLTNGELRASDNWQQGIPLDAYMSSGWRHHMDWWKEHRKIATPDGVKAALCGVIFNASGYLHELLKEEVSLGSDVMTASDAEEALSPSFTGESVLPVTPNGSSPCGLSEGCPIHRERTDTEIYYLIGATPPVEASSTSLRGSVYLAGPMRGLPEFNFPAFHAAAARLRADGFTVISPAERDLEDGFDPNTGEGLRTFAQYMEVDLPLVCAADNLVLLPGWETSEGVALEKHVAETVGKGIYEYEEVYV